MRPGLLPLECDNRRRGSPPLRLFGGQLNGSDLDTSVQIYEFDFGGPRCVYLFKNLALLGIDEETGQPLQ